MTKPSDDPNLHFPLPTATAIPTPADAELFADTPTPKPRRTPRAVDPGTPLFAENRPAKRTTPAARKPYPRWRNEDMPLRPGDVLAVGLDNGRCPVGRITGVNDFHIRLDLYSWPVGTFTAGTTIIRHEQVREFSLLAVQRADGVFEMDPLAAFQTAWTEGQP